ncbi:helix-turn-helix domain-containing protein [Mycobacterium adipatum]|uniref:helix-turn-helix domain-containing protein n=1 Tax=Mycobacterium adipatum TaxID=1682113 RepID=UPI000B057379|nr:helix-turn-helix transcriptional regulator [Mycobacterium adipatum]
MREYELVRKPLKNASESEPGPATIFFSEKFNELLRCTEARDVETGQTRKAKCTSLAAALKRRCRGKVPTGLSQANLYRFTEAKATPNIETVYELARVLNVSPREFLPDRIID